jgi:outer membrane receptor for ferrienterochelin and colicin
MHQDADHRRRHPSRKFWARGISFVLFAGLLFGPLGTVKSASAADLRSSSEEESEPSGFADDGLGGDDLAMFEDMPVVVTASRVSTPLHLTPVPVSLLRAEDLHYGGWISVPEALQFLPGVDMLRLDRRRAALGIRGLHETYSDRTLAMINGRRSVSPTFGGPEFHRLPLLMADIEQIEVVRGPGGAAWGSDAMNGVINVITKAPQDCRGIRFSSTITEFGDSYSQARWADVSDHLSWRISLGWQDHRSSEEILDLAPGTTDDGWDMLVFDSELRYALEGGTRLSGGLSTSRQESDGLSFFGYDSGESNELRTIRAFARMENEFDGGGEYFIQSYYNGGRSEEPTMTDELSEDEIVLETQLSLPLGETHELSFGMDLRYRSWSLDVSNPLQVQTRGKRYSGTTLGLFAVDSWRISSRARIESQLRGDYMSEGEFDWSGRITGIYAHDAEATQVSRLSVARAYRMTTIFGEVTVNRQPAMGTYLYQLGSAQEIHNDRMWSFEAGHSIRLHERLQLNADAYVQVYEDLVGATTLSATPPIRKQIDNVGQADAGGIEIEARYSAKEWWASAWYAYNEFHLRDSTANARAAEPSRHKLGLMARYQPDPGFALQAAFKYAGRLRDTRGSRLGEIYRLDLTATQRIGEFGELQLGVWDLFDEMGEKVMESASNETPGRSFFVRLQLDL